MNKKTRIVIGLLFLIITAVAVTLLRIDPNNVTPIQSTESKTAGILLGLGKGLILTQEITAAKDYITGIDLVFTHGGRNNTNQNLLLLTDTSHNILSRVTFSSSILKEGDYDHFSFKEPVFIGKGKPFCVSLLSVDGTEGNAASPLANLKDSIGTFSTSLLNPDDIPGSLKKTLAKYRGSLMLKTFETNHSQFWLLKIFLYFIILLITVLILWSDKLSNLLAKMTLRTEYAYLAIAIPFSILFAIVTPPYQVPDSGTHFKLSYNVSELGFLSKQKTFPTSIATMDTSFMYMRFLAGEKTTRNAIQEKFSVKINPDQRSPLIATDYTLPYIPQAIGIFIGKLFSSSLLTVMYFGRFFNLVFAVLIMFFAIRLVPEPFRLVFMLLALMPKTLFLFGSLSYDSLTISLSFLTIAIFFYYAFLHEQQITYKDLIFIALPVLMLLLCKPPYFFLGALFFIIPARKFGKLYKFIWMAIGIAFIAVVFLKVVPMVGQSLSKAKEIREVSMTAPGTSPASALEDSDSINSNQPLFKPEVQLQNILSDIPAYLKLIYKSGFVYYRTYIVKSFIGVLGYIDVELPDMLTYSYLALILLISLVISADKIKLTIGHKALFVILLALTFIIVETAMYMYATRPGRDRVFGVQGRYFIPMAPLFFMIFYNRFINPLLNLRFSLRWKEYKHAKPKARPAISESILHGERLFDKYMYFGTAIYCTLALVYSIYLTIIRYYM